MTAYRKHSQKTRKIPFKSIPEIKDRSGLDAVELPNPYEIILTITRDERVKFPWDFVRHYCDQTHRPG